jgi:lipopolysaccharide O-acetyltransferase
MGALRGRLAPVALSAYRATVDARNKAFSLLTGPSFASFGARSVVQLPVRLSGEDRIEVGSGVFVGAGSWLQVLEGGWISIGDGTAFSGNVVVSAARRVTIGRRVLVARGVYIADHGHAHADTTRPVIEQGLTDVAPVEIGDGAWLGENVVVCPGVRIGRNAVIGANAVVTRDVPDASVAVGIPARVVRHVDAGRSA